MATALLPLALAAGREFPKNHRETEGWPAQSKRRETGEGGQPLRRALRKQLCFFLGGLEVRLEYN